MLFDANLNFFKTVEQKQQFVAKKCDSLSKNLTFEFQLQLLADSLS